MAFKHNKELHRLLGRSKCKGDPAGVEPHIRKLLSDLDQDSDKSSNYRVKLLNLLALNLYDQKRYEECIGINFQVIEQAALEGSNDLRLDGIMLLGLVYRQMGDKSKVAETMREGAGISIELYGPNNPRTFAFLCKLETWYREWGLDAGADIIAQEVSELVVEPDDC